MSAGFIEIYFYFLFFWALETNISELTTSDFGITLQSKDDSHAGLGENEWLFNPSWLDGFIICTKKMIIKFLSLYGDWFYLH